MTFGTYIEALASTGLFGKNKARIGRNLFGAAGSHAQFSDEAVKSWINGNRNCKAESHFPDGSIDESKFIRYFESRTKGNGSWKDLQKNFQISKTADADLCVDLETEYPEVFYWSLLNRFQRIFHLPESEAPEKDLAPLQSALHKDPSPVQMRDAFLADVSYFGVMEIINRKPAVLNRTDSAHLNTFLDKMDLLAQNRSLHNISLSSSINAFIEVLRIQTLTLDANLNLRYEFEDNTASFNMEDDEDCEEYHKKARELGVSELSLDLILEAADPVGLAKLAVTEWGNFRDEMNCLFENISSWQDKS